MSVRDLFPDFTKQFNNFQLKVSSMSVLNRIEVVEKNGGFVLRRGVHLDLLKHLRAEFNFSFAITKDTFTKEPGKLLDNGTWTGVMRRVLSGKADIGTVITQHLDNFQVVDFTRPVTYSWLTFTTSVPRPMYSLKALLKCFTIDAWICILIICSISIGFLMLLKLTRPSSYFQSRNYKDWTVFQMFAFTLRSVLQQECQILRRACHSLKMYCSFWFLFAIIVSTAYKSKLVSSLAFPLSPNFPASFDELAQNPSFEIIFNTFYGAAHETLSSSTNPTYSNLFDRAILETNASSCLHRVVGNSTRACISYASVAEFITRTTIGLENELRIAPAKTFFVPFGWILRKNCMFTDNFNGVIERVNNMGLVDKWISLDYASVRRSNMAD
ncbi:unnamed protein product, partial [Allacma fusca]